jgi:hypothetical protein
MKKIYFSLLTIIAISVLTITQANAEGTYLQNHYGAQIQYIELSPSMIIEYPGLETIKTIGNGQRVKIDSGFLSIRTVDGRWYDLTPQLQMTFNPTERRKHINQNAVIYVLPSYFGWNIRIDWEKRQESRIRK